jgi:hypothetical protein
MAPPAETYRRLPGRRRGIGSGASLWMGSDHILLVRSAWFREEYKRFYLRDIQAIVVAPCARFYVSMPMLIGALLWLLPGFAIGFWPYRIAIVWGVGTMAMAATWLGISIASSCRCRLCTAVSKDDLPSLYRTWTARKFLRRVKPWIDQVQGVVDSGWAEAERSNAGPVAAALAPVEPRPRAAAPSHTMASDLFVISLFVSSLVGLATVHSRARFWVQVNTGLTLVEIAGAIAVLIEYYRGGVGRATQRLAVSALVLIGLAFYMQTFAFSFANAGKGFALNSAAMAMSGPGKVVHQVTDGLGLLLGFVGAAIILRGGPDIIKD